MLVSLVCVCVCVCVRACASMRVCVSMDVCLCISPECAVVVDISDAMLSTGALVCYS